MDNPKRILIIEDDLIYQETLSRYLEGVAECVFANTLEEAKQLLNAEDTPDHALVDYRLPDGLGSELVPILKEKVIPSTLMSFLSPQALQSQANPDDFCNIVSKEEINKNSLMDILGLTP